MNEINSVRSYFTTNGMSDGPRDNKKLMLGVLASVGVIMMIAASVLSLGIPVAVLTMPAAIIMGCTGLVLAISMIYKLSIDRLKIRAEAQIVQAEAQARQAEARVVQTVMDTQALIAQDRVQTKAYKDRLAEAQARVNDQLALSEAYIIRAETQAALAAQLEAQAKDIIARSEAHIIRAETQTALAAQVAQLKTEKSEMMIALFNAISQVAQAQDQVVQLKSEIAQLRVKGKPAQAEED